MKKTRELTGSDIQSLNQITEYLISNPQYDYQITEIILHSGYFTMWNNELHKNKWRYNVEAFINLPISDEEKLMLATRELEHGIHLYERFYSNFQQYIHIKETTNLRYANKFCNLYKNLVEQTVKRISVAKYALENT